MQLVLRGLHIYNFNNTLFVTNNVTITGNNTIDASIDASTIDFGFPIPGSVSVPVPIVSTNNPIVFTGAGHPEMGFVPFYLRDDDDFKFDVKQIGGASRQMTFVQCGVM